MTTYKMGVATGRRVTPKIAKIDKGIPIPGSRKYSELTEAALKMEIGDSVFIENGLKQDGHNMGRATGFKFSVRKEGDGYRVWRVA